jgi:hypothetical protein
MSIVMLQSADFGKLVGTCGLLANGLALIGFVGLLLIPEFYWIFPTAAAPFRMIWYILIIVKLFRLARWKPTHPSNDSLDEREIGR